MLFNTDSIAYRIPLILLIYCCHKLVENALNIIQPTVQIPKILSLCRMFSERQCHCRGSTCFFLHCGILQRRGLCHVRAL